MQLEPDKLGDTVHNPFLAGLLGGIVSLKSVPGATWKERLFNTFCAMLMAGFLSPGLAEFLDLTSRATQSATAFAVGVFGLNLVGAVVEQLRTAGLASFLPLVKRK